MQRTFKITLSQTKRKKAQSALHGGRSGRGEDRSKRMIITL